MAVFSEIFNETKSFTTFWHSSQTNMSFAAVFEVSAAASQENPAEHLRRCITGLQHCGFWIGPNRTNHWKLFDVSISQTADGMVT